MATEVYPVFAAQAINCQVTFYFTSPFYTGTAPAGYLNWVQDPGSLATLEARDTAVFMGGVIVSGSLATTEKRDTTQINSVLSNAPTETFPAYSALDISDQVTFNFGTTAYAGSKPASYLNWDEAPGAAVFGTLATTSAPDTFLFSASVGTIGALATTETKDTALFNGQILVSGTLTTVEARDIALFNGSIGASGVLITTEAKDTALFLGSLPAAGLNSNLAFTEPGDTAVFSGQLTGNVGTLIFTEATDTAAFVGLFGSLAGDLNTIEAPDMAFFNANTTPIPPVLHLEVLRFGIPVSLSRW